MIVLSLFKFLAIIIAGAICLFAFAPYNMTFLIGVSILTLLAIVNQLPNTLNKWKCIGYGYLYSWAFFMVQIYWIGYSIYYVIHAGIFISLLALVCFSLFLAMYGACAIAIYIRLKTKSLLFNSLFLFPSIWVLFEWLRGWIFGGYTWSDFGYTQVGNDLFLGYFRTLGEYGVSWLTVSLIGCVFVIAQYIYSVFRKSQLYKKSFRFTVIYTASILLIGQMLATIHYTVPYGKRISVALVQGNIGANTKWADGEGLRVYSEAIKETKADLIMLPETAISQFERNLPQGYLDGLINDAKANNANLIVGMPQIIDKKNHYINSAILVTSPDRPYYAKHHLVPFGEYIPLKWLLGSIYKLVNLPMVDFSTSDASQDSIIAANERLAFNICFENGFARELIGPASISTLMVNLSDMVWYGATVAMDQHLQLSQARAIENERPFLQVTNTSITAIINSDGKIQSRLPVFKRDILKDYVQGRVGETPFQKGGNWLIISICSLVILIALILHRFELK